MPRALARETRQRLESRLGHGEIDQVLGNALLLEGLRDHVAIAAGTSQSVLQRVASLGAGEIVDEHRDLIVEHERQVGLGGLDLGFGLGADLRIDGERDVVGFVDRGRLGVLLGEAVALLQCNHFELVNALDDLVELVLQARVIANLDVARQQHVEGLVEVLFGGVEMSGLIVGLAGGIQLFGLRDQGIGCVGLRTRSSRRRAAGAGAAGSVFAQRVGAVAWAGSLAAVFLGWSVSQPALNSTAAQQGGSNHAAEKPHVCEKTSPVKGLRPEADGTTRARSESTKRDRMHEADSEGSDDGPGGCGTYVPPHPGTGKVCTKFA